MLSAHYPLSSLDDARQRIMRTGLRVVAIVIVVFSVVDGLNLGRFPKQTLLIRLAWGGVLCGMAQLLPTRSMRCYLRVIRAVVMASVIALGGIIALTGGVRNPIFTSLPVLPVAALVFTQDDREAVHWMVAVNAPVLIWLLLREPLSMEVRVGWLAMAAGMDVIALLGARLYRARREAELTSDRARIEAIEKLALSERRRAESERLVLIGQLAAGVAHEINNPLAYARSNLAFLNEQLTDAEPEVREALRDTGEGLSRITQIVVDLRSFSRADAEVLEPVPLQPMVEEALRLASARTRFVKVRMAIPSGVGAPVTSRSRLLQVLVNLLVNAVDALESAQPRPSDPTIAVRACEEASTLRLEVEDNGPGIPPELLDRIFEPFFTTKPAGKGTGLGLSLSREYVERLSGRLTAGNAPGGGARFTVELPHQPRQDS